MANISLEEAFRQSLLATKKYIDNTVTQNKFSGDYNDLENRPCYDERTINATEYTFDGNFENKETLFVYDTTYVKIGEPLKTHDDIECLSFINYQTDLGSEEIIDIKKRRLESDVKEGVYRASDDIAMLGTTMFTPVGFSIINVINDTNFNNVSFPKGLWVACFAEDYYIKHIVFEDSTGDFKQLDEKYISYKPGYTIEEGTIVTIEDVVHHTTSNEVVRQGAEIFNDYVENKAVGYCSHAEGGNTQAVGTCAHAEGDFTIAKGLFSHAEGCYTVSSGNSSHTEGYWTLAGSDYQHVEGKFNIEDTEGKYIHIAGNGTTNGSGFEAVRSNAHTLDWDGNAWFQGNVSVNGTPTNNNDLVTKEYVDNSIANISFEIITDEDINNIIADIDN